MTPIVAQDGPAEAVKGLEVWLPTVVLFCPNDEEQADQE
jgi:hypothetical protein